MTSRRAATSGASASRRPGRQSKTRCGAGSAPSAPPARQPERGGRDEHARPAAGPRLAVERTRSTAAKPSSADGGSSSRDRAHLRGRREHARLAACEGAQLLGRGQRAEAVEQPLDEVDLRLRERRVEPDAAHRQPVARGRLDHVAARRAREVGVVEHDAPRAGRERLVERAGELAQRAAALVAVEAGVAARDEVLGDAALAGAGDAHDDARPPPPPRATRAASAPNARERRAVSSERGRARRGAAVSGRRAPGIATTFGDELEQPGERDLGRVTPCAAASSANGSRAGERARAPRPAERRVRDQRDAELGAALDEAAAQRAVVERAERDLHGRDRGQLERLVELRPVDVRHADAPHEPLVGEPRERAQRRAPRRARIGRMQQVQVDRQAVERGEARLAVGADRLARPSGTQPPPARVMPPLVTIRARPVGAAGRSARASSRSLPRSARAVSNTVTPAPAAAAIVASARSSSRSSSVESRMQHEADAELRGIEPVAHAPTV